MSEITLTRINYEDESRFHAQALFLHDLLKERDPAANISHKELPPFFKHLAFMKSRPYAIWNIIEMDGKPIGSIYLTEGAKPGFIGDEIGIFLINNLQGVGIGRRAIRMFMCENPRPKYYANISPSNTVSQSFFDSLGFKCIQFTYQLDGE